jgi:hypothetical protein
MRLLARHPCRWSAVRAGRSGRRRLPAAADRRCAGRF